ncbi:phosphatidate cytidylyltransferase [Neisseria animalis]|uniref:Phosphatidate cytidylyltransferase n=1 Tax=Neisseria animalis TaxID=492 RepID=A0A5P3MQC0_NEIAN|nr:phosphatidate cytidylyltransferase [Neisseria animalis]QEY23766.1 phosphatidate cytidylyltransferase [Neisseria animalis]ROW31615.1 phosphatidate cytidylyltransferase [Neisseria animalis]VEE09666.1 phosphatidate cytidylyltransferase [Neisseria animalis]
MLKQRIVTALWLLPLMLGMLFYAPSWLWAVFSALIALTALWEYARMGGLDKRQTNHYLAAGALFMLAAYTGGWTLPAWIWWVVLVFWLLVMPLWLKNKWTLKGGWQTYAVGWLLMMPFWFALVGLRPDTEAALPLLAVMGLVWVADIFAYFSGKAFGKKKLAPAISPGKSWEGVIGGAVCVVVYLTLVRSAGWLGFDTGWIATVFIGLILTAVSVCGDLLESWLKRAAGLKDSGNLLSGHGGVFDRVDSLIAVLSVYAAVQALF